MKRKTFKSLVKEVRRSFNLDYSDSEEYAKFLVNATLKEYNNTFKNQRECTITRED